MIRWQWLPLAIWIAFLGGLFLDRAFRYIAHRRYLTVEARELFLVDRRPFESNTSLQARCKAKVMALAPVHSRTLSVDRRAN